MADASRRDGEKPVSHWEELSSERVADCRIFDVFARRFRHPERRTESDFYVIETRDWVNVLPITSDGRMILVNQFRFGVKQTSWEIPGGVMESGEDPVEAGLRELREETGYVSQRACLLGSPRPNPAIQSNTCHVVLAEQARLESDLEWDEHEELEVRAFSIEEVYRMVERGEIFHSLVLNALLLFHPRWRRIQARRRSPETGA